MLRSALPILVLAAVCAADNATIINPFANFHPTVTIVGINPSATTFIAGCPSTSGAPTSTPTQSQACSDLLKATPITATSSSEAACTPFTLTQGPSTFNYQVSGEAGYYSENCNGAIFSAGTYACTATANGALGCLATITGLTSTSTVATATGGDFTFGVETVEVVTALTTTGSAPASSASASSASGAAASADSKGGAPAAAGGVGAGTLALFIGAFGVLTAAAAL